MPNVLDRIKRLWGKLVDGGLHIYDILPLNNREDDLSGPLFPLGVEDCHPVADGAEVSDEICRVQLGDDPDEGESHCQPLLDEHPDVRSRGEPGCVGEVVERVREVLEDLTDGDEPDEDLDKPEDGGDHFHPPRHEDDPHRSDGDIADSCEEDEYRDYYERKDYWVDIREDAEHRL